MHYLKLIIPIPIATAITLLTIPMAVSNNNLNLIIASSVKAGLLIYYLRLDNSGTPLIKTLTVLLIVMAVGEFLFSINVVPGRLLLITSSLLLGLTYFFRQKLKGKTDKLAGIKSIAVFTYGIANIIYGFGFIHLAVLLVGQLSLAGVYLYDRLTRIVALKNKSKVLPPNKSNYENELLRSSRAKTS